MMNWQIFFTNMISMLIPLCVLWLSYKAFLRHKTFENENHFFRYKMEQYHVIIQNAYDLHDKYYESFMIMEHELTKIIPNTDTINDLADSVDDSTDEFRLILSKHGAFISKDVVDKLDDFYNHLYDESEILEQEKITTGIINSGLKHLEKYENDLEAIINLMRNDLGVDNIDRRLKKRTHK